MFAAMKTYTSKSGNVAVEVVVGIVAVVGVVLGIAAIKAAGPVNALSQKVDEMSTKVDSLQSLAGRADQMEQDVKAVSRSLAALGPEVAAMKEQLAKKPDPVAATPKGGKDATGVKDGKKVDGAGDQAVASGAVHTVKSGDTLGKIAKQYKTTVATLEKLNPGLNSSKLKIGAKVKVK